MVTMWLDDGEDLEAQDVTGYTPFFNACCLGCYSSVVELLTRKGPNVDALDHGR